ncbi:MAG: hypothetical protein Q8K59_03780 [Nitrosomonas sp.]|nr:hypothetical protein [Nitrosomonas sp.]MDP1950208.1 hypothetical protein [Nitrosomonas sp.]
MKQQKTASSLLTDSYQREVDLKSANIDASSFIAAIDHKKVLTPALRELIEASLALQTTNPRILAARLKRSPATVRTEFQRILAVLGKQD